VNYTHIITTSLESKNVNDGDAIDLKTFFLCIYYFANVSLNKNGKQVVLKSL